MGSTESALIELFAESRDAQGEDHGAAGGQAGRFAPAPEPAAADPYTRRNEILTRWSAATVSLTNAARTWDEAALDRGQLPHPLLGPLTIREMLAFTVYHTEHHLRRVAERATPR